eukprot:XP_001710157.1 Hypothetical protein GL50803_27610 [Giardia lamblia ATCC 50803]
MKKDIILSELGCAANRDHIDNCYHTSDSKYNLRDALEQQNNVTRRTLDVRDNVGPGEQKEELEEEAAQHRRKRDYAG